MQRARRCGPGRRRFAAFQIGTRVALRLVVDPRLGELTRDTDGTVAVEYLILVSLVGFVVAAGVIFVGFPLLHQYRFMQYVLASPVV